MNLLQDIRYGARMLASKPGVTATAVLSLALGVGANSAVFSLIDAIMLRGLPVEAPDELVILGPGRSQGISITDTPYIELFSYPHFRTLRDNNETLRSLAAISSVYPRVYVRQGDEENPTGARARLVSGEYFSTFGVQPALGRLLGEADDQSAGAHPVAVLDYGYWQERFGGDPQTVGSAITVNDSSYMVVGVAPQSFYGEQMGERPDLYLPLQMQAQAMQNDSFLDQPQTYFLQLIGRLKPGTSRATAESDLARIWNAIWVEQGGDSPSEDWKRSLEQARMTLQPGGNGFLKINRLQNPLWLLFGVTALVMLIACANVANLLLARSAARSREMGVRAAMGADRRRLFTQLLTESLLLAGLAGVAALAVASWSRDALFKMAQVDFAAVSAAPGLDWRVLAFTGTSALLTGLLFGTAPAVRAGRTNLALQMRSGGRGTVGGMGAKLRAALVVGQAALSLLLLFGAGLFLSSLGRLAHADTGLAAESLLTVTLDPRGGGFAESEQPQLSARIIEAVEAVPGVRSAAMSLLPLINYGKHSETVSVPGYEPAPSEDMDARMFFITPEYFETVGTPIVSGRPLGPEDDNKSAHAVVVDEVFANRFFPGSDPLGRSAEFGDRIGQVTIVGVAKKATLNSLREPDSPTVYLPVQANPRMLNGLLVRASGDPAAIASDVRAAVEGAEPRLPINGVQTVASRLESQAAADRMLVRLISGFGVLALLLAAIGLYGVISHRVAGRTSEIGLRMAVGADRRDVLALVLKEGMILAGAGVVLGAAAAPFAAQAVEALLFQPETWNVQPLLVAAGAMLAVAALAALAPSLRAARLDPVTALREE